jgi:hypothetical protein
MVCFTQSLYEIPTDQLEFTFQLLLKYFPKVKCAVSTDLKFQYEDSDPFDRNLQNSLTEKKDDKTGIPFYEGRISQSFFIDVLTKLSELPKKPQKIVVFTARFWDGLPFHKLLPKTSHKKILISPDNDYYRNHIVDMITTRRNLGGREVFIQHTWDKPPTTLSQYIRAYCCCKHPKIPKYRDLLQAIESIDLPDLGVTNIWYSPDHPKILLLIDDHYPMVISTEAIQDVHLGAFDLDSGFSTHSDIGDEWQAQFHIWRQKFDATHGISWDEPILK